LDLRSWRDSQDVALLSALLFLHNERSCTHILRGVHHPLVHCEQSIRRIPGESVRRNINYLLQNLPLWTDNVLAGNSYLADLCNEWFAGLRQFKCRDVRVSFAVSVKQADFTLFTMIRGEQRTLPFKPHKIHTMLLQQCIVLIRYGLLL